MHVEFWHYLYCVLWVYSDISSERQLRADCKRYLDLFKRKYSDKR